MTHDENGVKANGNGGPHPYLRRMELIFDSRSGVTLNMRGFPPEKEKALSVLITALHALNAKQFVSPSPIVPAPAGLKVQRNG